MLGQIGRPAAVQLIGPPIGVGGPDTQSRAHILLDVDDELIGSVRVAREGHLRFTVLELLVFRRILSQLLKPRLRGHPSRLFYFADILG